MAVLITAACGNRIPDEALSWTPATLSERQRSTRVFETMDEARVLAATAGLLQDLGYILSESSSELGLIVGFKDRDATDLGQRFALALFGGMTAAQQADWEQRVRISVVSRIDPTRGTIVRATFQRLVYNQAGGLNRAETLNEPALYRGFFSGLSNALFLEAQAI